MKSKAYELTMDRVTNANTSTHANHAFIVRKQFIQIIAMENGVAFQQFFWFVFARLVLCLACKVVKVNVRRRKLLMDDENYIIL